MYNLQLLITEVNIGSQPHAYMHALLCWLCQDLLKYACVDKQKTPEG